MGTAPDVVAAYWAAAEARDWEEFAALLADDVSCRGPQEREHVRGRDAYVGFNAEGVPYDWHPEVERTVADGDPAASSIEMEISGTSRPGLASSSWA